MGASHFTLHVFGSSVAWGFPYAPACDVGSIVAQAWSGAVRGAELVVRNQAQYGAPSRYVVERARAAAIDTYAPGTAMALVYSGNNEFLHLSPPTGSHGRGPALATPDQRDAIAALHRSNIEAAVTELQRAGIEVVLSTIPANLRDWPPSYSVVPEDRAHQLEAMYATAAAAAPTDPAVAEDILREMLAIAPQLAQANFLLGRVYLATGRAADARPHLVAANDADGRPIRATTAINRNIRDVAESRGARLVDAETVFEATAPDDSCGRDQFWDDCHPTLAGYIQLADLLSAHIAEFVDMDAPPVPPADGVRSHHGIDASFIAGVYGRTGLYCYKHATCWDDELIVELAEAYLRRALAIVPESVEVHVALTLVLARRGDELAARRLACDAVDLDATRALWLLNGREARAALGALGIGSVEAWARNAGNGD